MFAELKYFNIRLLSLFIIIAVISCGGNSGNNSDPTNNLPSNITISIDIVGKDINNPNGDGSGNVILNFSAENTTLYKINLGDGEIRETSANSLSYKYIGPGLREVTVYVSAYNGNNFITKSITFTIKINSALLWSDEFNIDGPLNANIWGYDIGTGQGGWGNNESQYYTDRPENVLVRDGKLIITLKKENYQGSNYTSARILTKGKKDFKYGRVEVRAKLPLGKGTWPAIWMLGANFPTVNWPDCGEIDIMEHVGNSLNKIHGTLHYPGNSGGNAVGGNINIPNVTSEFNIYSIDWSASFIKFYVNNQLYFTFNNTSSLPFNHNFFIILNVAMGGNFGGFIDPAFTQSTMEIDYVRVYQ